MTKKFCDACKKEMTPNNCNVKFKLYYYKYEETYETEK